MTVTVAPPALEQRPCTVCELPVPAEDAHDAHEDSCPNRTDPTHPVDCQCDQHTHPSCCPDCTGAHP